MSDSSPQDFVPDRLFGRKQEHTILRESLHWASMGGTEAIFLSGPAGIGKSALVRSVFRSNSNEPYLFGAGKFDQFQSGAPYVPFMECFRMLIRRLYLEPEAVLRQWKKRIHAALGGNGAVIVEMIPEARGLFEDLPTLEMLPSKESGHRFERAFHRFAQVFTQVGHPLVLFIDDLQWADTPSLQLLRSLLEDPESQNLLVIAAYREQDWSTDKRHFDEWLEGEHAGFTLRNLSLPPFSFEQLHHMIAETLHTDPKECYSLAHVLFVKSGGNPLYIKQLLKSAKDDQALRRVTAEGLWEWDLNRMAKYPEIEGQLEHLTSKLKKIQPSIREIIATAACLGNRFTLQNLFGVTRREKEFLLDALEYTVREGLLQPAVESSDGASIEIYQFTHDRIQQAAYHLLDESYRKELHLAIARHMMLRLTPVEREDSLFAAVHHYNQALDLLEGPEREQVARMNGTAGRQAMQSSAYSNALLYFRAAIQCLEERHWLENYPRMFELHLLCASCANLCGQFKEAEHGLNKLLKRARNWTDRARVYQLQIEHYSNIGKYSLAIELGLRALKEAGVRISSRPAKLAVLKELLHTKGLLTRRMDRLHKLPAIADPEKKALLELLFALVAPTFFSNREVFAVIASKFVRLVYRYGTLPMAPALLASYAMLLGTVLGEYKMGYRLGRIAVDLADQSGFGSVRTKVYVMFYSVISPWVRLEQEDIDKLEEALHMGIESGDYVYASFAIGGIINLAYARLPMSRLHDYIRLHLPASEITREELVYKNALIYQEFAEKMGSADGSVFAITAGSGSETAFLENLEGDESGAVTRYQFHVYKLQLHYLFGEYTEALRHAEWAEPFKHLSVHAPHYPLHQFYEALTLTGFWGDFPDSRKRWAFRKVRSRFRQFKRWAEVSPENFESRKLLIEAEIARVRNRSELAAGLFDQAVRSAQRYGQPQFAAIANELAAKHHQSAGRERIAEGYWLEAHDAYGEWGAETKLAQLRKLYPGRFAEAAPSDPRLSGMSSLRSPAAGSDSSGMDSDMIAKASMLFMEGKDAGHIFKRLMELIAETADADKVVLLLKRNEVLYVEAIMGTDSYSDGMGLAVEDCSVIPASMIQYSFRLQDAVFQDVKDHTDDLFRFDPYLAARGSGFALAIPLQLQGQSAGMLYLEGARSNGNLHEQFGGTLRILASQAVFLKKLTDSLGDMDVSDPGSSKAGVSRPAVSDETKRIEMPIIEHLTARELEVLNMMAAGLTNKEMAFRLGVTAGTVKVHVHNLFGKLNVNRRTQAIAEAKRKQLLE